MLLFRPLINNIARVNYLNRACFNTSSVLNTFWESDEKGGYGSKEELPMQERLKLGFKELRKEIDIWREEMREHFEDDPVLVYRAGETDVIWKFENEDSLKQWVATSDSDHNEGYSKCNLTLTNNCKGLFSGELSVKTPKDGRIKRAGYCNIKTLRARKSFKRDAYLDWNNYNTLVLKVRGDGRSYMINIGTKGFYDVMWNDVYNYVLYTRGGPYWQISKIPFSKFFLSSKGRVQDNQHPLPLSRITSFGITVGDKISGPFSLEIDYVGVEDDPKHTEEFAYEMYKMPKYIVNT